MRIDVNLTSSMCKHTIHVQLDVCMRAGINTQVCMCTFACHPSCKVGMAVGYSLNTSLEGIWVSALQSFAAGSLVFIAIEAWPSSVQCRMGQSLWQWLACVFGRSRH